jgi:hypothetical protein
LSRTFAARRLEADQCAMKELPDDLALVGRAQLAEQRAIRDAKLTPLFRRWPALSRFELAELRRMYTERLRIARYLGRRRARD